MKKIFAVLVSIIASAALAVTPVMADVGNPPTARPRDVFSATFYNPGALTTSATSYTGVVYGGIAKATDMSNVDNWSMADVFVTAAISGTAFITVTPQFSNDWVNWRGAAFVSSFSTLTTTIITSTPIAWSLATTSTVGYPIPIQGDYLRFKIEVTTNTNTKVTPLVRVTFKNYGATQ